MDTRNNINFVRFVKFLEDEEILEEFKECLDQQYHNRTIYNVYVDRLNRVGEWVGFAFTWDRTKLGREVWSKLHDKCLTHFKDG